MSKVLILGGYIFLKRSVKSFRNVWSLCSNFCWFSFVLFYINSHFIFFILFFFKPVSFNKSTTRFAPRRIKILCTRNEYLYLCSLIHINQTLTQHRQTQTNSHFTSIIYIRAHTSKTIFVKSKRPLISAETTVCYH